MNNQILSDAYSKAISGGLAGSSAMVVQVTSLMWLRTTMNYQYRNGGTTKNTLKLLYKDGGIRRFYRGYGPALIMGPLSRFFDTASNTYVMNSLPDNIPTTAKTLIGSGIAATTRSVLMPIDTLKTTLQVEGKNGINLLKNKISNNGVRVLYNGTLASMSATLVGHYPWFLTYNILNQKIPKYDNKFQNYARNGFIGFNAAVISDCCSNSLRVIKTTKQTSLQNIGYLDISKQIIKNDGITGLLGRGLKTRILTNGLQGCIFTICWKYFEEIYFDK